MKTRALVNAALMLAIYMIFFVFYNMGIFVDIMSILLPIPIIIYSVTAQRVRDVLWLCVGCFIGTFLLGSVYGVVTTLNYGVVGAILGIGILKQWPYWQRILNASIVSAISFPITIYVVSGLNIRESVEQMVKELETLIYSITSLSSGENSQLLEQVHHSIETVTMLFPTILILVGLFSAFFSDTLSTLILKRMGRLPLNFKKERVQDLKVGSFWAIVLLICQAIRIIPLNQVVDCILLNVACFINMLFLLQGIFIIMAYFKSRHQRGLGLLIVILALISGFSSLVSIIGIMDSFLGYREKLIVQK